MSAPRSRSGKAQAADRAKLWLIVLTTVILVVRLGLASALPLTEDEAYYRLWSLAPALGYFDHPPMIAWWIWLGRQIAGDTALGVRLLPCLSAATVTFLVFDLAQVLGAKGQSALRAAVWYNSTLLIAVGGFLAVPDAPAALFWVASLDGVARAMRAPSGTSVARTWWLCAGAAAGLGALSKYSALFLGPGLFLWLITSVEGRSALRTPGPWLALASAGVIFSVNIGWNDQHHWATFAKQFGRIAPHRFAPINLANFIIGQCILLSPLIAMFLIRALRKRSVTREKFSLLWVSSLPFAAYLAFHALHSSVQAHWPAPLYAPLAMVAAIAAAEENPQSKWSRLRAVTPAFSLLICAFALMLYLLPQLGVPLNPDFAGPLRGWPRFATAVDGARAKAQATWVGTTSYGLAAQLLDQPQIDAPIVQISERVRWTDLKLKVADLSEPGLIVDLTRRIRVTALRRCFGQVTDLGVISRGAPGEVGTAYEVVRVAHPLGNVMGLGC